MGGIGMSALAHILLDQQFKVSGSDLTENYSVKQLQEKGAQFSLGHFEGNIHSSMTVVYSSGIKKGNPELEAAIRLNCPLLHRSELLAKLMQGYTTLAVAGTHGKTTTTSLLITIMKEAGKNPSFAVGGLVGGENGKWGEKLFLAEADESDGTFLNYHPFGAIITNMEEEHMEYYKTPEALESAFRQFMAQVSSKEHLFYCGDDPALSKIATGGYSYGFSPHCDLVISSFSQKRGEISYDFTFQGQEYKKVQVALLGKMNALNSAAAFALALKMGVEEEKIRSALSTFGGVKRRLEKKGEFAKILFFDDYAHHPTEVKKTLFALKESYLERRLVVLFQPHRFSRTKDHFTEFATAFEAADQVFVTDIYSAGEEAIEGIHSENLVQKARELGTVPIGYLPKDKYVESISAFLRPHDILVTMGAGDVTYFSTPILQALEKKPALKFKVALVFGGKSPEHEISLRSTRYVYESLNKEIYAVELFGIDRKGEWVIGKEAHRCLLEATEVLSSEAQPLLSKPIVELLSTCDIFFPVLHGPNGEDGTIQGFFEMLGKPYAGPDFRSCAITMDKILTKKLVAQAGVSTSAFVSFSFYQWQKSREELLAQIQKLPLPVYVKPSRCGSSIGVSPVTSWEGLEKAVDLAFRYDEIILVEEGTVNGRELEFAVMGNTHLQVTVPTPGEKIAAGSFVDYQLKYSTTPVKTTIDPILDSESVKRGQALAQKAYEGIGITGISRVDCLLDPQGKFNFFEVNAIPGLTKLSLFPKIWAREGVTAEELVDRCILLGLTRRRAQDRHQSVY